MKLNRQITSRCTLLSKHMIIITILLLLCSTTVLLAQTTEAFYFATNSTLRPGLGTAEVDLEKIARDPIFSVRRDELRKLLAESVDQTPREVTDRIEVPMDDFPIDSTEFSVEIAPGVTQEFSMLSFSRGGTAAAFVVAADGDDEQFLEFNVTDAFPVIISGDIIIWTVFFSVTVAEAAPGRPLEVSFVTAVLDASNNILGGSIKAHVKIITGTDEPVVLSIAQARDEEIGSIVTVEGIVTRVKGRLTRIQDETAGIAIFQDSGNFFEAVAGGAVLMGDRLRITGEVTEFNSLKEITNPANFEVLSSGNDPPQPQLLTLAEIAQNGEEYESELISVRKLDIAPNGDTNFIENRAYQIADSTSQFGEVSLFVGRESDSEIVNTPIPSTTFSYIGVLGQFSTENPLQGYQFIPVLAEDIVVDKPPATLQAEFTADPKNGTAPLTVQFTDQSTGEITSRSWDFGDGRRSEATNPVHTYQQPGTYTVSLTVSSSDDSDTETKENFITVRELILAAPRNLTAALSDNDVTLNWDPPSSSTGAADTVLIAYDDGTTETALTTSTDNFELCVRFTPTAYPASLLAAAFVGGVATPDNYGLFVYLDPDGDNNGPSGQPVFEGEIEISSVGTNGGRFPSPISIESGDFYISLAKLSKTDGFAVGLDTNSPDAQRSWAKLGDSVTPLTGSEFAGNLVINALVAVPSPGTSSLTAIEPSHQSPSHRSLSFPEASIVDQTLFENISNPLNLGFQDKIGLDKLTSSILFSNIDRSSSTSAATLVAFNVYRSATSPVLTNASNRIAELGASVHTFIDATAQSGDLFYVVTAQYDEGESGPSNEVQIHIPGELSIAEARTKSNGTTVTVKGIVTRAKGRLVRIQDETAGMTIFVANGTFFEAVADGEVHQGDLLRITGELSEFNSMTEIINPTSFEVVSSRNELPQPQLLTLAEIAQNGEEYESELIRIEELEIDPLGDRIFQENKAYPVQDQFGSLSLFIRQRNDTYFANKRIPTAPVIFIGILGQFSPEDPRQGYQLVPVAQEDISDLPTSVRTDEPLIPKKYSLSQNHPNPFNPETIINYQLAKAGRVKLEIYNLSGQRIVSLIDGDQQAGTYTVKWNGRDSYGRNVASGLYVYRLQSEDFEQVRKMTLIR